MLPSSRPPLGPEARVRSPSRPAGPPSARSRGSAFPGATTCLPLPSGPGNRQGRAEPVRGSRYDLAMRLVIARCSVDYTGRLSAHLPLATRLLLVKADGSVLVHSDGGAYKPLMWMSAPCTLVQEPDAWRVSNRTGESMTVHIEEILHDSSHDLG